MFGQRRVDFCCCTISSPWVWGFYLLIFTPFAHHFFTSSLPATVCLKPDIQDGWVVDDQGLIYAPGQMVTFQCQEGYSLRGSAQALCQKNGSWDPPAPLCDPLHSSVLPRRAESSGNDSGAAWGGWLLVSP